MVKYVEEIDARVVMTVRFLEGGTCEGKAAASIEYQPGATASAEVALPEATMRVVREALEKALPLVEQDLGRRLSQARHDAYRTASAMRELDGQPRNAARKPPTPPLTTAKTTSGRK